MSVNWTHAELSRRIDSIYRWVFPRVIAGLLDEVVPVWKRSPPRPSTTAKPKALVSCVKRLKTNAAIQEWLWNKAPLVQVACAKWFLAELVIAVYEMKPDDVEFERLRMKLSDRYLVRDAILAGWPLAMDHASADLMVDP